MLVHGAQLLGVPKQSAVGVVGVMADEHCTDVVGVGLDENCPGSRALGDVVGAVGVGPQEGSCFCRLVLSFVRHQIPASPIRVWTVVPAFHTLAWSSASAYKY